MKQHENKKCRIFTNPAFLFLYLFFLKKTKKKRFTINLSFNFSKNCCKDITKIIFMGVLFQFFGIINCFLCLEGLLKGLFL